jgi:hypothetical protein
MDIRLFFTEMCGKWNYYDNGYIDILSRRHNVTIDSANPNLVITQGRKVYPNALTLYYNEGEPFYPNLPVVENVYDPDKTIADYFLGSFFFDFENYTRFSLYSLYTLHHIKNGDLKSFDFFYKENREIPNKEKFCAFVSRGPIGKRGKFFEKLNARKKVEASFSPYNDFQIGFDNSAYWSSIPKVNFIKKYKFNLCWEGTWRGTHPAFPGAIIENGDIVNVNGLTNEKIVEAFIAGTIPIYWGNSKISEEFNKNTFLNLNDFESEEALIDKIIEIDQNDDLYKSFFKEKIAVNDNFSMEYLSDLFDNILYKYKDQYFHDQIS